ncbi:hypothetical protein [Kitasatospora kifunensis]|uniref:Ricin B lectin domain-containing protein n=1 Tax=Kitasatospora kifunensis TaxID=58351 RepID=A0A7W7R965_KITKI|nr:hypothetical protein [Kitasatospora kifunensis]MBB4927757.1 hypothetical protein [Kitasatospora kifunensis]
MRKSRVVKALLAASVAAPLLTLGMAGPASADGQITWQNGLYDRAFYLFANEINAGPVATVHGIYHWHDVENSDGTWNEVDGSGRCLTGNGRNVYTENCNSSRNGTDAYERWHEINMGSGNGWKLQNVQSGYFLDWTGNPGWGTVYAHAGDANNANERWY